MNKRLQPGTAAMHAAALAGCEMSLPFRPIVAWCLFGSALAEASGETLVGNDYLNLSFTGDGATPSATQLFAAQERKVASGRASGTVSNKGDAGYSVGVPLPPARLAPSLGLSYSSAGGEHSVISRGWSLDTGMSITRLTGQVAAQAYWDVPNAHRISGGGLDGLLIPDGSDWKYVSTGTVGVDVTEDGDAWVVRAGGITTRLEADSSVTWTSELRPTAWHITSQRDANGNTVSYDWSGNLLQSVSYGGQTDEDGDEVPGQGHLMEVSFVYAKRTPSYQAQDGHVDVISARLRRIVVATRYGTASLEDRLEMQLDYDTIDRAEMLVGIIQNDPVRAESLTLAELAYAPIPDFEGADTVEADTPQLGYTLTSGRVAGQPSTNDTSAGLFDLSGDGLVEGLSTLEHRPGNRHQAASRSSRSARWRFSTAAILRRSKTFFRWPR